MDSVRGVKKNKYKIISFTQFCLLSYFIQKSMFFHQAQILHYDLALPTTPLYFFKK
jgi:hypothetical protein